MTVLVFSEFLKKNPLKAAQFDSLVFLSISIFLYRFLSLGKM